jgi:hypothetical protein
VPQLRQAAKQHPLWTGLIVVAVLLFLLWLWTMGFTHSSGGFSAQ